MDSIFTLAGSEWMAGLGWTLVHSLWQMGLIAILVLVAGRIIPSDKSALRYWSSVGFMSIGLVWIGLTFVNQVSGLGGIERSIVLSDVGNTLGVGTQTQMAWYEQISAYVDTNMSVIISVWCLGLVVFSLKLAGGWLYLHKLRRDSQLLHEPELNELLSSMVQRMKVRSRIVIAESRSVATPLMIGVFKPIILLPISYLNHLSMEETEAILAHELAHVKRHDFAVNIVQTIVETILFFNPFVWFISNQIREEREHCCDDLAIKTTGEKKIYAETLATVQELQLNRLALGMAGPKGKLFTRVHRLFEPSRRKIVDRWVTAVLMIAMIGGLYWQGKQIDVQDINLPLESATLYPADDSPDDVYFLSNTDTIPPAPPVPPQDVVEVDPDLDISVDVLEIEPALEVAVDAIEDLDLVVDVDVPEIVDVMPMMDLDIDAVMDMSAMGMNVFVDTIPVDMEEMKSLIQEQMRYMQEHQELMKQQMAVMKEEMSRMHETMQSEAVQEALKMVQEMEFEGLSDEEMQKLKFETQKAHEEARMEMRKAMKEMEMNRLEWEREHTKMLKEQEFMQQEQMAKMKKEMEATKAKLKEVEKKHKAFYKELKKELVKDGYLDSEDSNLSINENNGEMTVNGKKVKLKDKQKYDKMRKEFFKE